eukprot:SAG31_NODE_8620_length_1419_cov_0.976515_1_plen_89_part_00
MQNKGEFGREILSAARTMSRLHRTPSLARLTAIKTNTMNFGPVACIRSIVIHSAVAVAAHQQSLFGSQYLAVHQKAQSKNLDTCSTSY